MSVIRGSAFIVRFVNHACPSLATNEEGGGEVINGC